MRADRSPTAIADRALRPIYRLLHEGLRLSPAAITYLALALSLAAAAAIAMQRLQAGLILMAASQLLDGFDGGVARLYGLASPEGHRLDMICDRIAEAAIFVAFAAGGWVSIGWVALALVAIALVTSIEKKSRFDPGFKRFVLYFGLWYPYPLLFRIIFGANLAVYVIGLLIIDCRFQTKMDALGGDLDTVASRALALEE